IVQQSVQDVDRLERVLVDCVLVVVIVLNQKRYPCKFWKKPAQKPSFVHHPEGPADASPLRENLNENTPGFPRRSERAANKRKISTNGLFEFIAEIDVLGLRDREYFHQAHRVRCKIIRLIFEVQRAFLDFEGGRRASRRLRSALQCEVEAAVSQ